MIYLVHDPICDWPLVECIIEASEEAAESIKQLIADWQTTLQRQTVERRIYESQFGSKAGRRKRMEEKLKYLKRWDEKHPIVPLREFLKNNGFNTIEFQCLHGTSA